MELKKLTEQLVDIRTIYLEKFNIEGTPDWHILKIQEEVGEMVSAYLKITKRARLTLDQDLSELNKNLQEEVADVLAMTLLFAVSQGIDIEKAIENKWFQYLNKTKN